MKNPLSASRYLATLITTAIGISCFVSSSFATELVEPKIINPGPPPADAIVLFDGTDLSKWANNKGGEAKWTVKDGVVTVNGTGYIHTKQEFGDCQLHLEWATPSEVKGDGQGRGNSGVFMQSLYEIQVLDSYNNKTYFDGQAGSVYKQYPPLVNVCRKPGEWQTYDIIYHAPRFDTKGKLTKPATVTVLQMASSSKTMSNSKATPKIPARPSTPRIL